MSYLALNDLELIKMKENRATVFLPDWVKGENLNQDERFYKLLFQEKVRKKRKCTV